MQHLARRSTGRDSGEPTSASTRRPTYSGYCACFPSFDALYTSHGLPADEVATTLTAMAERTLCRDVEPVTEA